jgi:hypothetical protein
MTIYECPDMQVPCEEYAYIIANDFHCTYVYRFRVVVIYSIFDDRSNVYVIELENSNTDEYTACEIVNLIEPLSLERAQKSFPDFRFTEKNYGF